MPITRSILDRLADWLYGDGRATYRVWIKPRIAPRVLPLIDRLVGDDEDGETIRLALIPWRRAERPVIAVHGGDISTCRIDGPWQKAGIRWIPLGGLVRSSGITWHLTPFEAQALHNHMQRVIDDATCAWINEHGPERCHAHAGINREEADREAKAMIAAWAVRRHQVPAGEIYHPEQQNDV